MDKLIQGLEGSIKGTAVYLKGSPVDLTCCAAPCPHAHGLPAFSTKDPLFFVLKLLECLHLSSTPKPDFCGVVSDLLHCEFDLINSLGSIDLEKYEHIFFLSTEITEEQKPEF